MYSMPLTPSRNSYSSPNVRDYGSSGIFSGRGSFSAPVRNEASFNDIDFNSDVVSVLSNDILATVDEDLLRLEADNVSALYNNAADAYSNNRASIFVRKLSKESGQPFMTKKRLVVILAPALGIEFARVFTSLFMFVNLNTFFGVIHDLSLPISGLFGICFVQCVAMRLRSLSSRTFANPDDKRSVIIKYFICYQLVTIISTILITGMSWAIVTLDNKVDTVNLNSTVNDSHNLKFVTKDPPLIFSAFLIVGYILVTSFAGSGQYILLAFVANFDSNASHQSTSPIIVVWSGIGGVFASFIGILDTVSNWCPYLNCYDHVTVHAAILSSITVCLSIILIIVSSSALYLDNISKLWERVVIYCKTHFFIDPNYKETQQDQPQNQIDKTAQEDFDECAALLEASGRSFSSSHFTGHSIGSQNTLLDSVDDAGSAAIATTNIKFYAHQIPTPDPTLKRLLKRKEFVSVVILVLFLSCLSTVFQYYTTEYLGDTVFNIENTHVNVSTGSGNGNDDGGRTVQGDSSVGLQESDKNKLAGLKFSCAGAFLYHLIFLIGFWKREWISNAMNLRCKPLTCPIILLMLSVFAITFIATDSGAVFLFTAFIFGMTRLVETQMLHTTARRVDRSWPPVDDVITSTTQTFIWSLVPLSMVISTIVVTPLKLSSGSPHAPMVLIIVLSVVLLVGFGISRVNVI